ncbi:hypothetical protein Droror1_Dr00012052 [Drosera rotundifolia]
MTGHDDQARRPGTTARHNDQARRTSTTARHDDQARRPGTTTRHDDQARQPSTKTRHDDHARRLGTTTRHNGQAGRRGAPRKKKESLVNGGGLFIGNGDRAELVVRPIEEAKPVLEIGKLREILDPDLDGNPEEGQLHRLILAATLCLTTATHLRPHMKQILKLLEGKETIEDWMKSSVHQQDEKENLDGNVEEVYTSANTKSHLSMAFFDVDDDFTTCSSLDHNGRPSLEEYLNPVIKL